MLKYFDDSCYVYAGVFSVTTDMPVYESLLGSTLRARCIIEAKPPPLSFIWEQRTTFFTGVETLEKTVEIVDNGLWRCTCLSFCYFSGNVYAEFTVVVLGKLYSKLST